MRGKLEKNVEVGKIYTKGSDIRATGGTCELRGYVIVGVASMRVQMMAAAGSTLQSAIFPSTEASRIL